MRPARGIARLAGLLLVGVAAGAESAATNFSQYPGFAEYFAAHPPAPAANEADRALSRRHAPRFHLPSGHEGPIDFYRDYVGHGTLVTGDGTRVENPSPSDLNRHRDDPRAQFVHVPGSDPPRAVVYAGVERSGLWAPGEAGGRGEEFIVATYYAVFRTSGLPAALPTALELSFGMLADLDDWHQLDHYTAAFVVLDANERPLALTLQQHNYQRTYLVGETVATGRDGRFDVDVAVRSNELYPHTPGRRSRRAVRFLSPEATAFMMGYGTRPLMSADDVTEPVRSAEYTLEFLPGSDAFYTFQGYLGERRLLPGRDGPPGARYNTLPGLKPLPAQILGGYWRVGNDGDWARYRRSRESSDDPAAFAREQAPVFHHNLACLRQERRGCTLR